MHYGMPCKLLKVLFYVRFDFVEMQAENLDRVEGWGKKLWRQEWTDWQPFHSRKGMRKGKGKERIEADLIVNCNYISDSDLLQFPKRI